ncbi:MAG: long-chain fatty aldehyde decarbonylase [Firmicutes bacterium]|nr:long-chain fatty aldehyde decarbonylase [Bacillota bacterium]
MIRVFPDLRDDDPILALFHKGVKGQWSASEFDWTLPFGFHEPEAASFARILTPVYLGEQTAMLGASTILQHFAMEHETSAELYITTFMLDEARHFEMLTRVYKLLHQTPLEMRDLREMFRYHHRLLKSKHRIDWLFGILVSDLFAKNFYGAFRKYFPDTLFGKLSVRIISDEARHQAFAEHYLGALRDELPHEVRDRLLEMRDDLLFIMQGMLRRLAPDAALVGIDGYAIMQELEHDVKRKVDILGLEQEEREAVLRAEEEAEHAAAAEASAELVATSDTSASE